MYNEKSLKLGFKEAQKLMSISPRTKDIIEWLYCIVIAVVLALFVRYFVGTPTIVKQKSMYPTLQQDQRLILNRWAKTTHFTPQRGDIITFEAPSESYVPAEEADLTNPVATYENEPQGLFNKFTYYVLEFNKTSYIKRVIGLPGEHIKIENGKVYVNGEELEEPYLQDGVITTGLDGSYTDITVPEGTVFAMGDNREQSTDCRRFGCIPFEKIESKVVLRFWPLNVFGKIDK